MTKEEAWKIIELCRNWNTGQKSTTFAFHGIRTDEDDYLDARRVALKKAWEVVGKDDPPPPEAP